MRAILTIAILLGAASCGEDKKSDDADKVDESVPAETAEVSYPDSVDGLTNLFTTAIAAIQAGDGDKVAANLGKLALEEPEAWFSEHFDEKLAKELAHDYEKIGPRSAEMEALLRSLIDKGQVQVSVERFSDASDGRAVGYQVLALKKMTEATTLYSVRIAKAGEPNGFHLWSFIHDGRRFRWVGKMKAVSDEAPATPDQREVRVDLLVKKSDN